MVGPPPLTGVKVLELAGLAPAPFAGMLLADAGAFVLRVDRAVSPNIPSPDVLARRKASIAVDFKDPRGISLLKELVQKVDVVIDPYRPGVLEKLGLGPDVLLAVNPRLIYARMAGFRRDGKYAHMAGHDINYLAVAGVLGLLGRHGERPHAPLNILADFAGGGAVLVQGILLALLSRQSTGSGQVVEANMVDGSSYLATFPRMGLKTPVGNQGRGRNLLDGGSPFYDTYETRDGKFMAVGALEPHFFRELLKGLGLAGQGWEEKQQDREQWPQMRQLFTQTFLSRTRAEWENVFDGTDACCTPVLDYAELETAEGREGDQRPIVTLRSSPLLAVKRQQDDGDAVIRGQGQGVAGDGYKPHPLTPRKGGEEVLSQWMGWSRGTEYEVNGGGLVLKTEDKERSKL